MQQLEIGGAQALLLLTKEHKDDMEELPESVEAAVLRYVGGTLEEPKRELLDYQWERYLDDDVVEFGRKKRRKSFIDPELAELSGPELSTLMGDGLMEELVEKKPETPKYSATSLDALVAQAAAELCAWYKTQDSKGGPRVFSAEEIAIMESFVDRYCQLHSLLRKDVCRRVWAAERTKDSFWELAMRIFPYRLRALVYKHMRRQFHHFSVRAKWTREEDLLLEKLAVLCAQNWKHIGEAMRRMPEDCRDRWRNYVKCGDNRARNKWLPDEEQMLRGIVMEMLRSSSDKQSINWTLVSERMNGVRLRIQCRYKWNKIMKNEQAARQALMPTAAKLWIIDRLRHANDANVDWDYLASLYYAETGHKSLWTPDDFRCVFEKMHAGVRGQGFKEALAQMAAALEAPKPYDAEREADRIANEAVAAVELGVTEQEAQPQEFSLWR